jgi:hypothetical protein
MENRFATIISYLFHPMFAPLYMILFLLKADTFFSYMLPPKSQLILIGLVCFTTILVPVLIIYLLYRKKLVRSFFLETKEERIYPLLVISVFYYLTYYLLKGIHISPVFSLCMLGATFLAILSLIITFYIKISLHMVGIGGITGLITGLTLNLSMNLVPYIMLVVIISGMTAFSRIKLNSHKQTEVYSGFLMGAAVMFLLFFLI